MLTQISKILGYSIYMIKNLLTCHLLWIILFQSDWNLNMCKYFFFKLLINEFLLKNKIIAGGNSLSHFKSYSDL